MSKIKPVTETLFDTLHELNTPDAINVEFGVKLGGKAQIVFAVGHDGMQF